MLFEIGARELEKSYRPRRARTELTGRPAIVASRDAGPAEMGAPVDADVEHEASGRFRLDRRGHGQLLICERPFSGIRAIGSKQM